MDTDDPPRAPEITTQPRSVRVSEGGIIGREPLAVDLFSNEKGFTTLLPPHEIDLENDIKERSSRDDMCC